ncbi:KRFT protein, partial [Grantiella picta]|nr:KRFT protein [Grantiella picta]
QMFPELQARCPPPAACSSSQPCAVSCGDSRVIIFPPPVVVTFPAPILTSCPQETVLGSAGIPPGASLGAEIPLAGGF